MWSHVVAVAVWLHGVAVMEIISIWSHVVAVAVWLSQLHGVAVVVWLFLFIFAIRAAGTICLESHHEATLSNMSPLLLDDDVQMVGSKRILELKCRVRVSTGNRCPQEPT